MKTDLVNNLANEVSCQLQYYKNFHLAHKKNIKNLLILVSTIFV